MNTKQLLKFIEFTHKFQQVKRILFVNGENRDENDTEHSFQLAFLGWYLVSSQKLNYDTDLIIKYSMVHDLVEIYAGDTYFESDQSLKDTKEEREKQALKQIESKFPYFPEMTNLIREYEERNNRESQFVYALDKMIPVLNIYLDKGRSWKRDKVTFEMIRNKDHKIKINDDVMEIWLDFMKLVEREKEGLFNKPYIDITPKVNAIVKEIIRLKKVCYSDYELPISFLTIFSQTEKEYDDLRIQLSKLGEELPANNGFKYQLKTAIKTKDGDISLIRIRKPDVHRKELGCADLVFQDSDYSDLRKIALEKGFDMIVRNGYEMIELSDFNINVYAYLVKDI